MSKVTLMLLVLLTLSLHSSILLAAESDCMTAFDPDANGHNWANAYLLGMLSCLCSDPFFGRGGIQADDWEDFKVKAEERFSTWGFRTFEFLNRQKSTADTQVTILSTDDVTIVVFRATDTTDRGQVSPMKILYDTILTDLNFALKKIPAWGDGVRVHTGFWNAQQVVWDDLLAILRTHVAASRRIWVTGCSLGGALATLAGYRLIKAGIPIQGIYAFSSPAVGNAAFQKKFQAAFPQLQRWVFTADPIPLLPPRFLGFRHVGQLNNITRAGGVYLNDSPRFDWIDPDTHLPGYLLRRLYNRLPNDLKEQLPVPPQN